MFPFSALNDPSALRKRLLPSSTAYHGNRSEILWSSHCETAAHAPPPISTIQANICIHLRPGDVLFVDVRFRLRLDLDALVLLRVCYNNGMQNTRNHGLFIDLEGVR